MPGIIQLSAGQTSLSAEGWGDIFQGKIIFIGPGEAGAVLKAVCQIFGQIPDHMKTN